MPTLPTHWSWCRKREEPAAAKPVAAQQKKVRRRRRRQPPVRSVAPSVRCGVLALLQTALLQSSLRSSTAQRSCTHADCCCLPCRCALQPAGKKGGAAARGFTDHNAKWLKPKQQQQQQQEPSSEEEEEEGLSDEELSLSGEEFSDDEEGLMGGSDGALAVTWLLGWDSSAWTMRFVSACVQFGVRCPDSSCVL